ncbi:GCN5-related N-acetyltransferase [Stanieria cyanosphaera PCC 7437]|uniref:GCN5-related N-acetyltransferase n=1 Tax=Stanieria cyanosphaera (strain ATCC 29371 / PCC 7437) TaxID=111780 RepID=K9XPF2_STAC7|nr:GNAT family N-acetyltransferase [Stanieria cyanosphaera]AFZ34408.1 GCN5-related N-acetyltransferase [Stanieria cyanosphaera PCC 7437]
MYRKATNQEDCVIAQHFYQLWLDNEVSPDLIRDDWLEVTLKFIDHARQELLFQAFVAEIEGKIIASASCQLFAGLYPSPFKPEYRYYGYIWNVYVESAYRRQGIASKLSNESINYLKSLGCTRAILHASPHGKPIYEKLGFVANNEMRLELIDF